MEAPRPLDPADVPSAARLWHDGWHEAHAAHLPDGVIAQRTLPSFTARLEKAPARFHVIGPVGAPLGVCAVTGDELDQLFVAPVARGTGTAMALLRDGERRLAKAGVRRAHLFCLLQNDLAARFYARAGWERIRVADFALPALSPPASFPCVKFERNL